MSKKRASLADERPDLNLMFRRSSLVSNLTEVADVQALQVDASKEPGFRSHPDENAPDSPAKSLPQSSFDLETEAQLAGVDAPPRADRPGAVPGRGAEEAVSPQERPRVKEPQLEDLRAAPAEPELQVTATGRIESDPGEPRPPDHEIRGIDSITASAQTGKSADHHEPARAGKDTLLRVSQHLLQEIQDRQSAKDEGLEGPTLQKYTFYLEERDSELLEEVKRQLRRLAPKGEKADGERPRSGHKRKRGFDLSALVRYALRHTFEDCV